MTRLELGALPSWPDSFSAWYDTEGPFPGLAFSPQAVSRLEPQACVEGPHESINSVVSHLRASH
jgi:hypothetical protein